MRRPKQVPRLLPLLLLCASLAACGGPSILNHELPALGVDMSVWDALLADQCPPTDYGRRECAPTSDLGQPVEAGGMGCDAVSFPDDLLGGLRPADPLLRCEIHPVLHDAEMTDIMRALDASGDYVLQGGGLWPVYTRYVVLREGAYTLLKNRQDLQAYYAPIETLDEALSFALMITGYQALYGLQAEAGLAYEVDTLEDTSVALTPDGYQVRLYVHQVFGCGPHWTDVVWVTVSRDGTVTVGERTHAFRDPKQDGLCVD